MKKVLWLTSWYPHHMNPLVGDFIQRHARAVSLHTAVHLIYVVKDETGSLTKDLKIEKQESGNLCEVIAYYKPVRIGIKIVDKPLSLIKYLRVYKQLIRTFIKENGLPSIIHVHVTMWAGVLARWIKKKYLLNYFLTEHWTGFDPRAKNNFYSKNFFFRTQARQVIRGSSLMLPVSRQLGNQIRKNILPVPFEAVPNVVDTRYFKYVKHLTVGRFRFIHVSSMGFQKNIEGILTVLSKLLIYNQHWEMILVGPEKTDLRRCAGELGLNEFVVWKGVLSYEEVAAELQQASAMVMFSRYENQPCVILEAQCCGLPVIATAVGGIKEIVQSENGILVEPGNEEALLNAMIKIIDGDQYFDRFKISSQAMALYNYNTVGKKISGLYESFLQHPGKHF